MKTIILNIIFFLLGSLFLHAQTKVGGYVYDDANDPVAYANVIFKGTSVGVITDENGKFYIEDAEKHTELQVSFMSYKTQIIPLKQHVTYNLKVILEQDVEALGEVLIVSGKQPKKNNPAIDLLRKVWENKRSNGVKKYKQYEYDTYEKVEFDLNTIDSALVNSRFFRGMEFIFEQVDTSNVTGKTYLPIFINETASTVYGDNETNLKKTILRGNKNSGFSNSQTIIDFVDDLYADYDVYDNYIKIFEKSFTSPISRTGINTYSYLLADSMYIDNKWCYNIVYYPRRKNELTFKGDFWVADTTFAIKKINMQASKSANINWIKDLYIEQEFEVLNDSVLLLKRDYMMSDFTIRKKENSRGMYGKRTTIYNNYKFDKKRKEAFYDKNTYSFNESLYHKNEAFWQANRLEKLSKDELGVYKMLDTLKTVGRFKRMLNVATIVASNYIEMDKWDFDYGPILSSVGLNEIEGWRLRVGGRTYRGPNDLWRLQGFVAYGLKDDKVKYGLSGKWLLDKRNRFIISAGNRRDIEQIGANLTATTDVLGRSFASSSLFSQSGPNDKLTNLNFSMLSLEMEPLRNIVFKVGGVYKTMSSASSTFKIDYYDASKPNGLGREVKQFESSFSVAIYPNRQVTGYGVERRLRGKRKSSRLLFQLAKGEKGVFNSDFDYTKLQLLFSKPWAIGAVGQFTTMLEAGKTFGAVPLSLLNIVPGNESFYSIKNTFLNLEYYEFITDSYVSLHLEHNFNGRIFSRIPLLRKLNLREFVAYRMATGTISNENKALSASNIPYVAPNNKPYYEYSFGIGNIFKLLRVDFNFRGNYLKNANARPFGMTLRADVSF